MRITETQHVCFRVISHYSWIMLTLPIYFIENIEMIQKRAMKATFPGMSYADLINHINVSSLKEWRDNLCKTYFINYFYASSLT